MPAKAGSAPPVSTSVTLPECLQSWGDGRVTTKEAESVHQSLSAAGGSAEEQAWIQWESLHLPQESSLAMLS